MVVTFSHPKGGVGKSTLALNYLVYLQKEDRDFIVVDLDGQHSISNANKLRAMHDLDTFKIEIFNNTDSLINYISEKSQDSLIIIDSGGFDSANNRIAISMSDVVITPLSDSPFEVMRLISFDEILSDIEMKLRASNPKFSLNVNLVLNKINPNTTKIDSILAPFDNTSHYVIMDTIIRDRSLIKFSPSNGASVLESKSKTNSDVEAKNEINAFCKEVDKLIQGVEYE